MLEKIDTLILCGGLAKRLGGIAEQTPKAMVPVEGRPFLEILIDYIAGFGLRRFILCTGHLGEKIREYFSAKRDQRTYEFSQESELLGTAGAVKNAASLICSDPFLALNGDSFCRMDYEALLEAHRQANTVATLTICKPELARRDAGYVKTDKSGKIVSFNEKNFQKEGYMSAGIYALSRKILDLIPARKASFEEDVFPSLAGKSLAAYETSKRLYDIGTPERLEIFRKTLTT